MAAALDGPVCDGFLIDGVIDGKAVAARIREEIGAEVALLKAKSGRASTDSFLLIHD